jgi:hypothetical protein
MNMPNEDILEPDGSEEIVEADSTVENNRRILDALSQSSADIFNIVEKRSIARKIFFVDNFVGAPMYDLEGAVLTLNEGCVSEFVVPHKHLVRTMDLVSTFGSRTNGPITISINNICEYFGKEIAEKENAIFFQFMWYLYSRCSDKVSISSIIKPDNTVDSNYDLILCKKLSLVPNLKPLSDLFVETDFMPENELFGIKFPENKDNFRGVLCYTIEFMINSISCKAIEAFGLSMLKPKCVKLLKDVESLGINKFDFLLSE